MPENASAKRSQANDRIGKHAQRILAEALAVRPVFVVALDTFGGFAGFLPDRDDPAAANAARRPELFPPGLELFEHGEILAEAACWTRT